ncbi:hypothetical protein [Cellulomonas sp. URHB0016]
MSLLLGQDNTWVICATAEALLARHDRDGLALVLRAAARAEDPEIEDHLNSEFSGLAFRQTPEVVRDRCVDLLDGADERPVDATWDCQAHGQPATALHLLGTGACGVSLQSDASRAQNAL